MEQSPSLETNWFSASLEILRILWNSKVNFRNHKCPLPVPILSRIDIVHALISNLLKIHLTVVLPSMAGPSKWSLSLRFSHKNPVCASTLPHNCYMSLPHHSSRFDHRNNFGRGLQIIKLLLMYFSLHFADTSSPLDPNIVLSTRFSINCSLHSSLNVSDQVLHPCERAGKLYLCIA
jgi:hypothetical protein